MSKSKPYRLVNVKDVRPAELIARHPGLDLAVGIDVAKDTLKVGPWWSDGTFSPPWRVDYVADLPLLIGHLEQLNQGRKLIVALEPTGTYSDPLRWALHQAGLFTQRIQTTASRNYAEVFDGVPSNHDAKDALMLGKLAHQGDGRDWPLERPEQGQAQRRLWVITASDLQKVLSIWTNRLEAHLARHWPEVSGLLDLQSSTLISALIEYGSPAALAADPQAAAKLRGWGGRRLVPSKVQALIDSARTTRGMPASALETEQIRRCATHLRQADSELEDTRAQMAADARSDKLMTLLMPAVGPATACLLVAMLGDPRDYSCARAYLKAAGLNLKERSSGRYQGQLKISKRGPSVVRKWLYLAALRLVSRQPRAARWLARYKAGQGPGRGGRGLVAIMRKLLVAIWHMARTGRPFAIERLLGGRGPG